ncbi:WbqC family protein [Saccharicrinis aurantiacus]|uniref:WbqC family protein n=1 Tax=Saccharicrinis aurantiacus TaxID=1849719 RepID=UPI0024924292|nr:WbqC family protein [Saccharicrinis aurantiacus]
MQSIFTSSYLPPVQFMSHWVNTDEPIIEAHCNYAKQTYRNRCDILGANGPISLIVPVIKGRRPKVASKDVEIAYYERWQDLHWRSILSAYKSSPFFEYYMDDFAVFYEKQYKFLLDFNNELMQVILDALDINKDLKFTEKFDRVLADDILDYRESIHPKKDYSQLDLNFKPIKYRQVFSDRYEFIPNLSVIDLIFNKGPEAIDLLEDSILK